MTTPKKRFRVGNLRLREISSVDRPAQVGAVSVLMKRAGEDDVTTTDIRKNAAAVATGSNPAFTVTQYEDAMFARAADLSAELGCTPEQALAKCLSSDPALRDFAHASEVARCGAYATEVRKRHTAAA
ncbi:hypothetical protein [Sphingomonas sp.]|uniref:hypothetical protein n=1 Tax=Sphingomonas sp. TaxID=28214 RepID=UPI002DD69F92|nr:hypothetical protein [Sphingomonas sp.]